MLEFKEDNCILPNKILARTALPMSEPAILVLRMLVAQLKYYGNAPPQQKIGVILGTLAVVHALFELDRRSRGMFMHLPCQDIFEKGRKEPFTDLDLMVIRDGKFLIGEVKSKSDGFKSDDFTKIQEVVEDLLPKGNTSSIRRLAR